MRSQARTLAVSWGLKKALGPWGDGTGPRGGPGDALRTGPAPEALQSAPPAGWGCPHSCPDLGLQPVLSWPPLGPALVTGSLTSQASSQASALSLAGATRPLASSAIFSAEHGTAGPVLEPAPGGRGPDRSMALARLPRNPGLALWQPPQASLFLLAPPRLPSGLRRPAVPAWGPQVQSCTPGDAAHEPPGACCLLVPAAQPEPAPTVAGCRRVGWAGPSGHPGLALSCLTLALTPRGPPTSQSPLVAQTVGITVLSGFGPALQRLTRDSFSGDAGLEPAALLSVHLGVPAPAHLAVRHGYLCPPSMHWSAASLC